MPLPGRILPYLVQRRLARVMLNAQNNMVAKNNSKETRFISFISIYWSAL